MNIRLLTLLTLLLAGAVSGLSWAQSAEPTPSGTLRIAVVMPDLQADLTNDQREKLYLTVTNLLTNNGLAAWSVPGNIVLLPSLRMLDERTVNPGLQTLVVLKSELSLTLKQADNSAVFSTLTRSVQGSGRTRTLALNDLLNQLNADDPALKSFLSTGQQKAVAYYNRECSQILSRAGQLSRTNQFETAFGLLLSVPQGVSCYDRVQTELTATFRQYQQRTCAQRLQQARTRIAARDFDGGLSFVSLIDPQSPCAAETKQLIEQAARETSADNKQRWDVVKTAFVDYRNFEQYRLRILSDLLMGFYPAPFVNR